MFAEVASSFIIIAHMTLLSGEEVTAYGEQYPTLTMCQKEAAQQTAAMNREIKNAMQKIPNPVFKEVRMECWDVDEMARMDTEEMSHE